VAGNENKTVIGPVTVLVVVSVTVEVLVAVDVSVPGPLLVLLPQAPCAVIATATLNNAPNFPLILNLRMLDLPFFINNGENRLPTV